MSAVLKPIFLGLIAATLYFADFSPGASLNIVFVGEAHAILGVGRRTVRRTAIVTTAAVSSENAAQNQAAADSAAASASAAEASASAAEAAAAASTAPAPASAAVPVGTTITELPAGCVSTEISNVSYFNCNGTYYKPAFQSNNLVYVVTQP